MKLTTNSILIALAIMACFPVTLIAMPLLQPSQPNKVDSIETIQAIVTQTMIAATQNAPTPIPTTVTPIAPTSTPMPFPRRIVTGSPSSRM